MMGFGRDTRTTPTARHDDTSRTAWRIHHLGERVSALADGEVDHDARDLALAHAADCATCLGQLEAERRLKQRLAGLPNPPIPVDLTLRLLAVAAPVPEPSASAQALHGRSRYRKRRRLPQVALRPRPAAGPVSRADAIAPAGPRRRRVGALAGSLLTMAGAALGTAFVVGPAPGPVLASGSAPTVSTQTLASGATSGSSNRRSGRSGSGIQGGSAVGGSGLGSGGLASVALGGAGVGSAGLGTAGPVGGVSPGATQDVADIQHAPRPTAGFPASVATSSPASSTTTSRGIRPFLGSSPMPAPLLVTRDVAAKLSELTVRASNGGPATAAAETRSRTRSAIVGTASKDRPATPASERRLTPVP